MAMQIKRPNIFKSVAARVLGNDLAVINENQDFLQERIAELEFALEDRDWIQIMGDDDMEFSREGLRKITRLGRLMFLKNPIIQRGVNVMRFYVWGQGASIGSQDESIQEVITDFMTDDKNQAEFTSHQARNMKEVALQTDGNIFFVFFPNVSTGKVRLRSIPFDEIVEIITNPGDRKEPWYYLRVWNESVLQSDGSTITRQRKAFYPDWRFDPTKKRSRLKDVNIHWSSPVYHVKVGGLPNFKFGVSEIYAALDWAKAYKNFLEDVATIQRAHSRFAWDIVTKGGKKGIEKSRSKFQTSISTAGASGERNPSGQAGQYIVRSLEGGAALTPVGVRGAGINPEEGRRILLMALAGLGLPETFFGDVKTGNLATAKSLDRPTELKMVDRQTLWTDVIKNMVDYVLRWAIKAPNSPYLELKTKGKIEISIEHNQEEMKIVWGTTTDEDGNTVPVNSQINIDFPPVVEVDTAARMEAIVSGATLGGMPLAGTMRLVDVARLVFDNLGVDQIDAILETMFDSDGNPLDPIDPDDAELTAEARFLEALKEFQKVMIQARQDGTQDNGQETELKGV